MKSTLIYNPVSGDDPHGLKITAIRETLQQLGIPYQFRPTQCARDGTRLAKEAVAEGSDIVIAAGGDGTANEVVNGLVGTDVKLALVPIGTGNLAAHEFGISPDPVKAVANIPRLRTKRIDLGKANGRYFLMMTSLGLDAQALRDAPKLAYRFFRWWSFYGTGFLSLLKMKPFPAHLIMDEKAFDLSSRLFVISNIKGYGLPGCQLISQAEVTDGLLDLGFFRSQSLRAYLNGMKQLGRQQPIEEKDLQHYQLKQVTITTPTPMPVQVDGDFFGYTPLEISVVPKSLSVLTAFD